MSGNVKYNPKPKGKPMSGKLWSEKLIENEATSNVILSRREWESLIAGIQSLEAELESARRDRGSGWDKFASRLEAVSDRKRLEAENAELREKLAEVTGHRDSLISNLAKSDSNKQELEAELARLKSQPEAWQWAVTCEGMTEAHATNVANGLNLRKDYGRTDHKAVRLSDVT